MRLDGFIFDIDGTLADSMGVWTDADRLFLNNHGFEYDEELSYKLRAMTFEKAAEYIRDTYCPHMSVEQVCSEITETVRHKYSHEVELMDGAERLINELCRRNIPICAATSNSEELARAVLENNGVIDHFDFILTCEAAGMGKESPEFFGKCLEMLGTDRKYTAVVEDSPHAAATAHGMGLYTIGVSSGYFGDFEALEECTDVRFENIGDITTLLQ